MWVHPLTNMQLDVLKSFGGTASVVNVVQPVSKTLACGEIGVGALAELDDIVSAVAKHINVSET